MIMYNLTRHYIQIAVGELFKQNKRYAGHSKWQNIRHIKGAKDAEKSIIFSQYAKRIKIAVAEGKSTKPSVNLKLANIIDEAKSKSMPIATINGVLEKIENSKSKSQSELVDFRGPGNSLFVIRLLTDNLKSTKISLNTIFRKNSCLGSDGKSINAFIHQGFILTEVKGDLDTATNDAIDVGAENVDEINDNGRFYRFTCNPAHLPKVTNHLCNLNYVIITADEEFIPRSVVQLSDDNLKKVDSLCAKLHAMEEVVSINHNIDIADELAEMELK